jgi:hypothetical protein
MARCAGYCPVLPDHLVDLRLDRLQVEASRRLHWGDSIAVFARPATVCWTRTKRQNSRPKKSFM